jgi:uncharacterized protein
VKAAATALLVLLISSACSAEADTPAPDRQVEVQVTLPAQPAGPVLDQAGVLPAASEAALDERLRRLLQQTGDAVAVVTVDSLEGETIEDYAFALFNEWGIGSAETNRGLLLLVAPNERQVRIEVGCGLESTVGNGEAAEIIEARILPEFKDGDFAGGTTAGVEALIAQLALPKPANDPGPRTDTCRAGMKEAA